VAIAPDLAYLRSRHAGVNSAQRLSELEARMVRGRCGGLECEDERREKRYE
jgi:hypothetical protein